MWRSFDLNVRFRLGPAAQWRRALRETVGRGDVLFATEAELRAIDLDPDTLGREVARKGGCFVLRRGDEETKVYTESSILSPARPRRVDKVVDVVGAGDAFAAAVTVVRLSGGSWEEAVQAGHLAGSQVVGLHGDFEGAPYREELDQLLNGAWISR